MSAGFFVCCVITDAGNQGEPGVNGITVNDLKPWLQTRWEALRKELLEGVRMLGIPTVLDRLIQQALNQVLQRYFDPRFSEESFGFRPRRSAHQAIERAREYIAARHRWVVDLEKFFDRVNHDVLMSPLARHIEDKRILRQINPVVCGFHLTRKAGL